MLLVSALFGPAMAILWGWSRLSGKYRLLGKQLANYLEWMGPSFIKLGQTLASRPDVFRPEIRAGLCRLQNDVRHQRWRNPVFVVRKSLGGSADDVIRKIDRRPVGCGSVAQVFKGYLKDGTTVAIKIVNRKHVAGIIADIDMALLFSRLLDRCKIYISLSFAEALKEVRSLTLEQADMQKEACHLSTIGRNLKSFGLVRIPSVVHGLCNGDILTMEYIHPLIRADGLTFPITEEQKKALYEALSAVYQMIFEDGLVHADLHAGNVGFSGEHLVLLDFGIVAALDAPTRADFERFFYAFVTQDAKACAEIIFRQSSYMPPALDKTAFVGSVRRLIKRHSNKNAGDFQITKFVSDLFGLQKQYGMVGSAHFVKAIFSLLTFEGVLKSLIPGIDFQLEAKIFLMKLRARSFPKRPWPANAYNVLDNGY